MYSELANELRRKLVEKTNEIVKLKGSKVGFKDVIVIDLDSQALVHSCSNSELRYIGEDLMYNEYGYEFSYSNLELDDFAELVDILTQL